MNSASEIWTVIIALGIGTFLIRFSFLGLVGNRPLPPWLLRHLRYTAVAILPALCAPLVVWPNATEGRTDPIYIAAAAVAFASGYVLKSAIWGMVLGAVALYGMLTLFA